MGRAPFAYYTKTSQHGEILKPNPCGKYREMTGATGRDVPARAGACKYFKEREGDSPPLYEPKG
jgi:hypothetical protein